jgi:hypothetical protein
LQLKERTVTRSTIFASFVASLFFSFATVSAQFAVPYGPGFGAYGGYGPYGGFGPYGGGSWGYGGYGPYGPNRYYSGYGGYGPLIYSQQLFQQQAAINQQIYQQQQQAIVGQVQLAQERLGQLDATKQQLLNQYAAMSDSDKAAVRSGLIRDYLKLDTRGREGWQSDSAVQSIIGPDLKRLDAAAQVSAMSEADRLRYKEALLLKYRALPPAEQLVWQKDEIMGMILGPQWWLK